MEHLINISKTKLLAIDRMQDSQSFYTLINIGNHS